MVALQCNMVGFPEYLASWPRSPNFTIVAPLCTITFVVGVMIVVVVVAPFAFITTGITT